jgi:hypothetical protein
MAKWVNRVEQRNLNTGFDQPTSKLAKLRAILPLIETALENGKTYKDCIEFVKAEGLIFSEAYFRRALELVRKMGPVKTRAGDSGDVQVGKSANGHPISAKKPEIARPSHTVRRVNGVVISSPVKDDDDLSRASPKMSDFL